MEATFRVIISATFPDLKTLKNILHEIFSSFSASKKKKRDVSFQFIVSKRLLKLVECYFSTFVKNLEANSPFPCVN